MATTINKNKVIAAAQKFVQKGQYDKAIKEYTKIVEEDPRDVRIWLKIGDLHAKRNVPSDAVETYSKVAEFYSEQGFYLKAVAVYKQILKIDSSLVDINLRLAELYKQLGLLSDAMRQYEQVSNFYNQAGRTKEALAALRQIVDLDPENVASRIKLAELYSKEGLREEAVEEFSKAADFLRAENRLDDLIKVAERLVFHQPENLAVTKELAKIYLRKRDPRRALQKLQLAFKADPRDEETLVMLAQSFEDLGQVPKTISVLKELAHIHGENGQTEKRLELYRRILALSPQDEEALQILGQNAPGPGGFSPVFEEPVEPTFSEPPIQKKPSSHHSPIPAPSVEEYYSKPDHKLGYETGHQKEKLQTYKRLEQLEEVNAEDFEEYGIEEEPEIASYDSEEVVKVLTEADVYIKYGLHEKAIDHLRQVFSRDPENTQVHLKLKDLYLQLGRYPEAARELIFLGHQKITIDRRRAAQYLNEALELDPENREARALLSSLESPARAPLIEPAFVDEAESGFGDMDPIDLEVGDIVEEIPIDSSGLSLDGEQETTDSGSIQPWQPEHDYTSDFPEEDYASDPHSASMTDKNYTASRRELSITDKDYASTRQDRSVTEQERKWEGTPGIIELHGETTDTLGTGTPSSEIIPLGIEHIPSESHRRACQEEESSGIEDDLEEAEFFIQQNLFGEARTVLEDLSNRYPGNPLVRSKLQDLESIEQKMSNISSVKIEETDLASELAVEFSGVEPAQAIVADYTVEDVFDEFKRGVEGQVDDEDSDTHYDLGIAYREMGLMDDAIAEFKVAMRSREKEVLCHMMIGLCFVEKEMLSEAISQFKTGLYVEGITERETIALYFELGQAYEHLDDLLEALYYYEKVAKKDPRFRDVASRIERIQKQTGNSDPQIRIERSENTNSETKHDHGIAPKVV